MNEARKTHRSLLQHVEFTSDQYLSAARVDTGSAACESLRGVRGFVGCDDHRPSAHLQRPRPMAILAARSGAAAHRFISNLEMSVSLREVQYETCSFGVNVLACPRCGGRLRLVALIDQASVVERVCAPSPKALVDAV